MDEINTAEQALKVDKHFKFKTKNGLEYQIVSIQSTGWKWNQSLTWVKSMQTGLVKKMTYDQ